MKKTWHQTLTFNVVDVLEAMAAYFLQLLNSSLLGKLLNQLHYALVQVMPLEPSVGGHSLLELMEDLQVRTGCFGAGTGVWI